MDRVEVPLHGSHSFELGIAILAAVRIRDNMEALNVSDQITPFVVELLADPALPVLHASLVHFTNGLLLNVRVHPCLLHID
jgi:hypothetical protein